MNTTDLFSSDALALDCYLPVPVIKLCPTHGFHIVDCEVFLVAAWRN